ncbi:MAG: VWA domain-containing protein [Planctomycetota bacterium]
MHRLVQTRLAPLALCATAFFVVVSPASAQGQGSAKGAEPPAGTAKAPSSAGEGKSLEERIDAAIAAYEKVLKTDKKNYALRRRTLGWLGQIDHPRVDDYLAADLRKHARYSSGSWAVAAIAKVDRPQLADLLFKIGVGGRVDESTRRAAIGVLLADDRSAAPAGSAETLDRLVHVAATHKNAGIRGAVLRGLASSKRADVHESMAELMGEGEHAARRFALIHTAAIRGANAVDAARVRCVKEGNLLLAATAWRVLAEQQHPQAGDLTVDVLERVYDKPDAASAAELVRGIVHVDDEDFYPALMRFGAVRGAGVRSALKISAGAASKSPALMQFLIDEGIESESAAEREAAKVLLAKASAAAIAPLVERIRKQLRRNRKKVLDRASGLHELLSKDPSWAQDVLELASERDLESRLLGMALMLESGSDAAVPQAQKYLRNRAWELRSLCFRYLAKCRDATSIPFLIDRYGREEGRLKHELETTLFAHTGTRCWSRRDWKTWWRGKSEGFSLPHPETIKAGGSTSGGKTVSYYDIPLVSSRIAFILDRSGSMQAKVGTDRKRTRLDLAKQQLRGVVEALPKEHKVNLIPFGTQVMPLWDEIEKLDKDNRAKLLKAIEKIQPGGGTNTFGALMRVYQDPDVDTVYLLTDGQPSAGELTDIDDILDAIGRENRMRQLVVHCIAVGMESRLLRELAAMTGGEYRYVR